MSTVNKNKSLAAIIVMILAIIFVCPAISIPADAAAGMKVNATVTTTSSYVGATATIKASAANGTAPYQYKYMYKVNSGSWVILKNFSTATTASFKVASAGTYTVRVYAKDKLNKQIYCDVTFTSKEQYVALSNSSTISATTVTLGKTFNITAKASGGTKPYTYAYYYKIQDGAQKTIKTYSTTSSVSVKLPSAGYYTVQCIVKDKAGKTVTKTFNVTVTSKSSAALSNTSTVAASSVNLGTALKITGKATGGTAPYQYAYYYSADGTNYTTISGYTKTATASVKLPKVGTYKIKTIVKDYTGKTVTKILTVTSKYVTGKTLTNTSTISSTNLVDKGTTVTAKASASGGTQPYTYAYYYRLGSGAWKTIKTFSTTASTSVKLTEKGVYTIKITVKDFAGKTADKMYSVTTVEKQTTASDTKTTQQSSAAANTNQNISINYGSATKITADNAGSSAQYAVYYKKSTASSWTMLKNYSTLREVSFRPREVGTYNVMIYTKVSNKVTTKTFNVTTSIPQSVYDELKLINAERAKAGVAAVKLDTDLVYVAAIRAEEIEEKYSHTRPDGSSCFTILDEYGVDYTSKVAENIAWGYPTVQAVMTGWMNSSGHKTNILNPKYTKVGIGINGLNWTQMFSD